MKLYAIFIDEYGFTETVLKNFKWNFKRKNLSIHVGKEHVEFMADEKFDGYRMHITIKRSASFIRVLNYGLLVGAVGMAWFIKRRR